MRTALVIIDMQRGFIKASTVHLVIDIASFIEKNKDKFDDIVGTRYINHENTACYRFEGWKKCMEGSTEAQMVPELEKYCTRIFDKSQYSCWTKEFQEYAEPFDKLYFVGVNTGCCVLHSAFDAYNNLKDCAVIRDLCGSTSGEHSHQAALQVLEECITKQRVILKDDFAIEFLLRQST